MPSVLRPPPKLPELCIVAESIIAPLIMQGVNFIRSVCVPGGFKRGSELASYPEREDAHARAM